MADQRNNNNSSLKVGKRPQNSCSDLNQQLRGTKGHSIATSDRSSCKSSSFIACVSVFWSPRWEHTEFQDVKDIDGQSPKGETSKNNSLVTIEQQLLDCCLFITQ